MVLLYTVFDHADRAMILKSSQAKDFLEEIVVPEDHVGVYFQAGQFERVLAAGRYCFWKAIERYRVVLLDIGKAA